MTIVPVHRAYLESHAVDPDVAERLGVRSITATADLPAQFAYLDGQGTPALLYPWSDGTREWLQLHPDKVPVVDGEERKYVFPWKEAPLLWTVRDPALPNGVLWVEGTKQALAAASTGIDWRVQAIAGCDSWYSDGAPVPSAFDAAVGLPLVVILDADVDTNTAVWDAADRMTRELKAVTGASAVRVARVPGARKSGLDDVLARIAPAQRLTFLSRVVEQAKPKMTSRPPEMPKIAGDLFTMRGRRLVLNTLTAARRLDDIAPFAVLEDANALYRYDAGTGTYHRVVDVSPFMAHLLGDWYEARFAKDMEGPLRAVAAMSGRLLNRAENSRLIAVANGVLDPTTGKLEDHSPDHLLLGAWAVEYDPDATCPKIMAYLETHFEGQVDAILDTAARMLERRDPQDRVLFLFGPPRTGKSTVLRLFSALVGPQGRTAQSLHQLAKSKWSVAQLYGKALNVAADLSSEDVQDTSTFKEVTGGDEVNGQHKYGHPFDFTNHALLMFSANEVPGLPAGDDAEFARFVPVRAGSSFLGKEDPRVEDELMAELPGLMNELVRRYQAKRKPEPKADVAHAFRLAADRVMRFVVDELVVWPADAPWKGSLKGSEVYARYERWAAANGFRPVSAPKFYSRLTSNGVVNAEQADGRRVKASYRGAAGGPQPAGGGTSGTTRSLLFPTTTTPPEKICIGREWPGGARSATTVDFETPDARTMGSGDHHGPFCRLLAFAEGDQPADTTADPERIQSILTTAHRLITHNGWGFDLPAAAIEFGLDIEELIAKADDTQVLARLANPPRVTKGADRDSYALADLAPAVLGEGRRKGDMLPVLKRRHGGYDRIPVDDPEYNDYAKLDVELTRDLMPALPAPDAYYERERRVAGLAGVLTVTGLRVDVAELTHRLDDREAVALEAFAALEKLGLPPATSPSSRPWTMKSAVEVMDALAREEGLSQWPRTEKGALRTDRELWQAFAEEAVGDAAEVARLALTVTTGGSSFLPAVRKRLRAETGRIHPQHRIQSATGRWATSDPNVMGTGKRSTVLLHERDVILAEPGQVFVAVDLAGIDQRAVWGLSGDEVFGELFAPGVDIHDEMSKLYFGDVSKPYRKASKSITHGIPYGRGAGAITNQLVKEPGRYFGWTYEDAYPEVRDAWRRYFERYAGVKAWQDEVRRVAEDGGTLDNGFGRGVRTAPDEAYTEAPARLAQAAARDLAMTGLLRIRDAGLWPMARLFIHDEVVLSAPEDRAQEIGEQVAELMSFDWESPSGVTVPIVGVFDGAMGPRWSDCYGED